MDSSSERANGNLPGGKNWRGADRRHLKGWFTTVRGYTFGPFPTSEEASSRTKIAFVGYPPTVSGDSKTFYGEAETCDKKLISFKPLDLEEQESLEEADETMEEKKMSLDLRIWDEDSDKGKVARLKLKRYGDQVEVIVCDGAGNQAQGGILCRFRPNGHIHLMRGVGENLGFDLDEKSRVTLDE